MTESVENKKADRKPVRRTASKEVRRMQLIDATIDAISKHGIRGTTMAIVTETAGLSQGIVNFHFQSKQNLFEETLMYLAREHHDEWTKRIEDAELSPAQKLSAIVDAHFTVRICSRKKLAVWFAFFGDAGRRLVYRKLLDSIDDERVGVSTALCRELVAEPGAAKLLPEMIAKTLEGLYDGLWLNILMYPGVFDRQEARKQIYAYLSSVFPTSFETPEV